MGTMPARRQRRNDKPSDQPGRTLEGQPGRTLEGSPGRTLEGQPGRTLEGYPGRTLEGQPGRTLEGQPASSAFGPLVRVATPDAGSVCVVNLKNVTRLTELEGGTEISFVGFEFDLSGPGKNPARLVVREAVEAILHLRAADPFVRLTLIETGAPVHVNLANITDAQAIGEATRVSFAAFGIDEDGLIRDDFVMVVEPPEALLASGSSG